MAGSGDRAGGTARLDCLVPMTRQRRIFFAQHLATTGVCIAVLIATSVAPADADRRGGQVRESVDLRLSDRAALSQLRAAFHDPGRIRPALKPVSDLLVRLSARGVDIDGLLSRRDAGGNARSRPLFRARIYAVIGGRIYHGASATCGPWMSGVSNCLVDCEAGSFSLVRRDRGAGLALFIAGSARDETAIGPDGPSLTACRFDVPVDIRLAPLSPGRGFSAALRE